MNVQDKVVIVTGASRGIGRQIALEFARRGAKVVLAARTLEARRTLPGTLGETLGLIEQAGGTAIAVQCDVAEPADLERLVAAAVDTYGRLDVVVNNAVNAVGGDFEAYIEGFLGKADVAGDAGVSEHSQFDDWLRQFATNVHGPYLLTGLATPHFRAQGGGVVVNITSGEAEMMSLEAAAQRPRNPNPGYATTKAALNRLTNATAAYLEPDNIAVVAVNPGPTHTEITDVFIAGGLDLPELQPMSVPAAVVLDIVTADDPMTFSGQVVQVQP